MLTALPGDRILAHDVQMKHINGKLSAKEYFAANSFTTKEYKVNRRNKYSLGALW